jgi:hypothetical protein
MVLTNLTFPMPFKISLPFANISFTERVCRKSPFESGSLSLGRRFLKQHPGVPFQLQLPLYFQTQPTITLHTFQKIPARLFERHPAIFSDGYANPGP